MNTPRWLRLWLLGRRIKALRREFYARRSDTPGLDRLEFWDQINALQSQRNALRKH